MCVLLHVIFLFFVFLATKSDVWLEIDPHSGRKLHTISSDGTTSSCPASETYTASFFIARTGKWILLHGEVVRCTGLCHEHILGYKIERR